MGAPPVFTIYPLSTGGNETQLTPSLNGGTLKISAGLILASGGGMITPMVVDGNPVIGQTYKFTLSDSGELFRNKTITGTYQGIEAQNISGVLNIAKFDNVTYSPTGALYINGSTLDFYLP